MNWRREYKLSVYSTEFSKSLLRTSLPDPPRSGKFPRCTFTPKISLSAFITGEIFFFFFFYDCFLYWIENSRIAGLGTIILLLYSQHLVALKNICHHTNGHLVVLRLHDFIDGLWHKLTYFSACLSQIHVVQPWLICFPKNILFYHVAFQCNHSVTMLFIGETMMFLRATFKALCNFPIFFSDLRDIRLHLVLFHCLRIWNSQRKANILEWQTSFT